MKVRKHQRVGFYIAGIARDMAPYRLFGAWKRSIFSKLADLENADEIRERVNYCNRLQANRELSEYSTIKDVSMSSSYYYYDLKKYAKAFPKTLRLAYRFGDVTTVPDEPSIVKSRPIDGDNENSVVMKLDALRHFSTIPDPLAFREKKPRAVWRGALNNPLRVELVRAHARNPRHDIGHTGPASRSLEPRRFLGVEEQLAHRYVISVEGVDVATNLKWIFASNSLCMMPRPRFETWFMEGKLQAGVHYVELRRDFADLEFRIEYYERNIDEAMEIVANANAHWKRFADRSAEDLVSLLVLQKYFERTGQLPPEAFSARLFD